VKVRLLNGDKKPLTTLKRDTIGDLQREHLEGNWNRGLPEIYLPMDYQWEMGPKGKTRLGKGSPRVRN